MIATAEDMQNHKTQCPLEVHIKTWSTLLLWPMRIQSDGDNFKLELAYTKTELAMAMGDAVNYGNNM